MSLSIRTRILLFLFSFALVPLLVAVLINLPLVIDRIETFYRHAFLQDLRADFRDLDQHLASRDEMVRLLAKLPEPGILVGENDENASEMDLARARYTEWINKVLRDQLDIIQVHFFDENAVSRFWLERDQNTRIWEPTLTQPELPSSQDLAAVLQSRHNAVLVTPVRVDRETSDPSKSMTLKLLFPVDGRESAAGVVSIMIDVGGLVRRDPNTLWVLDDGQYLQAPGLPYRRGSAFIKYPGLKEKFATGEIVLWDGDQDTQVIWVPLLSTEDGRPLWVGRYVNRQPLAEFRRTLFIRVLSIVSVLVVIIWLVSNWFARRLESFGRQLTDGISQVLEQNKAVSFSWKGARELEQLGGDLTRLSETHARHARNLQAHTRELEASNRYKSQFLANVSHELRTPLNSVLLLSRLLSSEEGDLGDGSRQKATVIQHAAEDLRSLIDNILDLSRIEAGHHDLHLEEIDLPQLLGDLLELLRPQFDEKGLSLTLEVADDAIERIESDPGKLRQIIKNFLANAVKFTATGGAVVQLSRVDGERPVSIRVSDTGIGIQQEKQELIFEAFKQADGSTSRRYGGTGLGLTISRELTQLLGGEIQVESEPDQGASFMLHLPERCQMEQMEQMKQQVQRLPTETAVGVTKPEEERVLPDADFKGVQVLVLEQDLQQLLTLTPLLEAWGLEVLAAGDEEEALETLAEMCCGLVLIDASMLVADGYASIEQIRKLSSGNDLIVVAILDEGTEGFADTAGVDAFIQKPVDPFELYDVLHRHLNPEIAPES